MGKSTAASGRIRDLNDAFRKSFHGGRVMLTEGIAGLESDVQALAVRKVAAFAAFGEDNDPHGEHDFGSFDLAGRKFFWKMDYYTPDLRGGSEDPADPAITTRVLTIMLVEEY